MDVSNVINLALKRKTLLALALLTVLSISQAIADPPPKGPSANFPMMPEDNLLTKDNGKNPYQSRQKFKQHVTDKYKQIHNAESDVKQTQHGLSGHMTFSGDIVPQKKVEIDLTKEKDRHVRARAIAKAFIDDESDLLGITNPDEIREVKISTDKGFGGDYTYINYRRYLNGIEFPSASIQITIGPEENIKHVSADLAAVPPEVYEATKKKTLSEEEIRSFVEADPNNKGKTIKMVKLAIINPPYVIWLVHSYWRYTINAFTGEILTKSRNVKKLKQEKKKSTSTDKEKRLDDYKEVRP